MFGGRTRARTWDPLIKSHQITLIYQAHFDISSVRSRIEPEGKSENVETKLSGTVLAVILSLPHVASGATNSSPVQLVMTPPSPTRTKGAHDVGLAQSG